MNSGKGVGFGPKVKNYVFSHCPPDSPTPGVEFVNQPIGAFAQRLRAESGKDIWMMGGDGLVASFLDEGEIDEFSIHVIPIFIGEGIPLVQAAPAADPAGAAVRVPFSGRCCAPPLRRHAAGGG